MRTLTILLCILLLPASALAGADTPPADFDAPGWAKALYDAVTKGEWKLVGGLGLTGLVFALRTWGAKLVPWFASKSGGLALSFAISLAGTIGLALGAGADITWRTILAALGTAATAAGLWEWLKSYIPSADASNEKTKAAAGTREKSGTEDLL